jgi:hypothetical protein
MARRNIERNETVPADTPGPKGSESESLFPGSEFEYGATRDNFYVRTTVPASGATLDALLPRDDVPTPTLHAPDFGEIHGATAGPIRG